MFIVGFGAPKSAFAGESGCAGTARLMAAATPQQDRPTGRRGGRGRVATHAPLGGTRDPRARGNKEGSSAQSADRPRQMVKQGMVEVCWPTSCATQSDRFVVSVRADVVGGSQANDICGAPPEHAVQLDDQQVDRRVGIVRRDCSREIRPRDLNPSFCGEDTGSIANVAVDVDAHAKNSRFVAKEPLCFGFKGPFHRISQPEVNAAKDEL